MPDTCWADPLSRKERIALARMLARACGRFYQHRTDGLTSVNGRYSLDDTDVIYMRTMASAEMSDLHMDVTERAAVTTS